MQTPLRVTFRHCDHSDALRSRVSESLAHLERFHENIIGCHAVIEGPSARHAKGGEFTVGLQIAVPGSIVNVSTARTPRDAHVDPYCAVRDAFDSAKRQLRQLAIAT